VSVDAKYRKRALVGVKNGVELDSKLLCARKEDRVLGYRVSGKESAEIANDGLEKRSKYSLREYSICRKQLN
jgi:hypothetical protein